MVRFLILFVVVALLSGCATPISTSQKRELRAYEAKEMAVEEKSVAGAALLGILPGGGSFYTRNYGWGVVNLLMWPLSVLWDPISGVNGAEQINYYATKDSLSNRTEPSNQSEKPQKKVLLSDNRNVFTIDGVEVMEKVPSQGRLLIAKCKKCKLSTAYYPSMAGSKTSCDKCRETRLLPN